MAALAIVVTVWVAVTVRPPAAHAVAQRGGLRAVAGAAWSWHLAAGAAMFGMASAAVWTFARDHVANASGGGPGRSTLLWVVLGVAEVAGIAAGDIITGWGLRRTWTTGLALLALSTAAIGLIPGLTPSVFTAITVFGATYVTLTTVVFLWSVRLHPEHPAAAVAFGFLAIAAGQAVAAPIVGAIADHVSVTAAFTACAALSAASPFVLSPRADQQHTVVDRDAETAE